MPVLASGYPHARAHRRPACPHLARRRCLTATFVLCAIAAAGLISAWQTSPAFAAEFTVNTTADTTDASNDGKCEDAMLNCSLRAAIKEANSDPPA
jgi:CSLREA domain-containing protein